MGACGGEDSREEKRPSETTQADGANEQRIREILASCATELPRARPCVKAKVDRAIATGELPEEFRNAPYKAFEVTKITSTRQLVDGVRDTCRNHSLETLAQLFKTEPVPREVASAYAKGSNGARKPYARSVQAKVRQACLTELLSK
jgi:hypothetical protein